MSSRPARVTDLCQKGVEHGRKHGLSWSSQDFHYLYITVIKHCGQDILEKGSFVAREVGIHHHHGEEDGGRQGGGALEQQLRAHVFDP